MQILIHDIALALRTLRRRPAFPLTVIATLALAIGANTAVFSLMSATLLQPLPFPDAERIAQFWIGEADGAGLTLSIPELSALSKETSLFDDIAAYDFGGPGVNIAGSGEPEQAPAIHASAAYFRLFGARTALGRTFTAEEDRPNGGRFVVISHSLWTRRFGSNPNIAGTAISLGNEPYTVTGVLEPGFRPDPPAQIWLPLQAELNETGQASYIRVAARLRDGVTFAEANAGLQLTSAAFLRRFPLINQKLRLMAKPLRETNAGDVRTALLVLFATVLLVLLIACANVANLLLARAAARRHETAIRASLGASRGRLVSQMVTESFVLAVAGGVAGLGIGRLALQGLLAVHPESVPGGASLDWRVLAFTAAVSLCATLLCGLLPALRASTVNPYAGTQDGGARTTLRAKSALAVIQVAVAVMLAVGAGLMMRTFAALRQVDPGFDPRGVLTLQMSLQGTRFADTASVARLAEDAAQTLERAPGVAAAASAWTLPVELAFGSSFVIEGRPLGDKRVHGPALMRPVSPHFASVFRLPVKSGRFFTDRDTAKSASVAVITESMARKYWPDGGALGERITIDKYLGPDFAAPPREIVGIAGDVRDLGMNKEPGPMIYIPQAQVPNGMTRIDAGILPLSWAIRTAGDPYSFAPIIQRHLKVASGGLATGRIRSMEDVIRHNTARSDSNAALLIAFAGLALLLAGVGVYGVMAFSVQQRTREIGIRLALGAAPEQVLAMVINQGLALTAIGVTAGAAGSVALARYMKTLLYGVQHIDALVIAVACLTLGAVALLAAYIPARRAARLDPVEVLRRA